MAVQVTITPITIPSIPGDQADPTGFAPSVYASQSFTYDTTFSVTDDNTLLPVNITSITCTPPLPGITITTTDSNPLAYKLRNTGVIVGVFTDEYYKFVQNKEVVTLPVNTTESNVSIVEWKQPTVKSNLISYTYVITTDIPGTINTSLSQYVYWNFDPSLNAFSNFVLTSEF
jgi:hypothetical protein